MSILTSLALAWLRHSPITAGESWLHQFLQDRVGRVKARIRTKDGFLMHLDTSDFIQRSIFIAGTWDEQVARKVRSLRPGDLFIDCGANVGFFSLLAASRGANVIAFEPNPACHAVLLANAKLNGFDIDARMVALSSAPGKASLHVERADNVGAGTLRQTTGKTVGVTLDTLDAQLATRTPTLIKVDVEGAEIGLIEGANRILATGPEVVMEISEFSLTQFGGSKDQLFGLMSQFGYTVKILSDVRRSNATSASVYFQYDVLFQRHADGKRDLNQVNRR